MQIIEYICLDCGKHGRAIVDDKNGGAFCAACGSGNLRKLSVAGSSAEESGN